MGKVIGFTIEIIGTEEQARELGSLETSTKRVALESRTLKKDLQDLRNERVKDLKAMERVTKRLGDNIKRKLELSESTKKLRQEIRQEIKLQNTTAGSIGRVNAELAIEKRRIKDIEIGSRGFKKVQTRIKDLEGQQRKFNQELGRGRTFVGEYERGALDAFKKIGLAIGGLVIAFRTLQRLTGGTVDIIEDFDDSVANLQKTTGLAKDEAIELARAVNQIDTRTSISNLLALASAAGRLGLEGQDIIDFTREVDKAFVALGDALEGDAEEIGLTLGKLAANFDLEERFGIGEAINKVGSSLNELGAQSKAQEGFIINFTQRLAGVAAQAKISIPDIQALGALFDETGQSVEVASTTLNKLLPAIGKDLTKFAKIAGLDVKEFRKVVEKDAFEALKLVAVGAQSSEEGLIGLTETLEAFGIESGRSAGIVGILASNTVRLTELQEIANEAFEEGTSLTKEFNIQNNTLSARIDKAAKAYELFILNLDEGNGAISSTIGLIVAVTTELFKLASGTAEAEEELSDTEKTARQVAESIIILSKAVLAVTVGFIAYRTVLTIAAIRTKILSSETGIYSTITGVLTGKIRIATIAQRLFNVAAKANPIGLVIAVVTAAATAFGLFGDEVEEATEKQRDFNKEAERLQELLTETENIQAQLSILDQLTEAQAKSLKQRIEDNLKANSDQLINVKAQNKKLVDEAKLQDEQLKNLAELKVETLAEVEARLDKERAEAFRIAVELAQLTEEKKAELTAQGLIDEFEANRKSLEEQKVLVDARIAEFERIKDARIDLSKEEQKALDALIKAQKKLFDELIVLNSTEFELENKLFRERRELLNKQLQGGLISRREALFAIRVLEQEHEEALDKIRENARKKREEDARKELVEQSKRLDVELRFAIRIENEKFVAGKQSREQLNEAISFLNAERVREELELVNRELDNQVVLAEGTLQIDEERNKVILERKEKLLQQLAELDVEDKEAELQRLAELEAQKRDLTQAAIEATSDFVNGLLDRQSRINSERLRKDTDEITKSENERLESLQRRLDLGLISEAQFESEKTKINAESEAARIEIQRRAQQKQQSIDTAAAIIAGALAIQRILATVASPELISDQILKGIAIASVVATTVLNVDAIQSQTFATGGRIPGTFDAKDNIPIRVSRGEAIVTPRQQSALGGGAAFRRAGVPGFQAGGVPLPSANLPAIAREILEQDDLSREEAVELIQEGVGTLKVEQVETETRDIAAQVDLIETTAEV